MKSNTLSSLKNDIKKHINKETLNLTIDVSFEKEICSSLIKSTERFNPEEIFNCIYTFSSDKSKRILFSEIYSFISGLDNNQNSILTTNIDTLLNFAKNKHDENYNDTRKIVIKIYDHVHLAILQDDKVNKFFDKSIKKSKSGIEQEIRTLQSQYVTILGIFSSFVVSFIGGLIFSTSVLSNIGQQSIYKLILIIILLGFVLISICFSLYWFIAKIINKCDTSGLHNIYKSAIMIIVCLLIILFISWEFGFMDRSNRVCDRVNFNNGNEWVTVTYENYNISTNSDVK